jgi:hypothetical protein
MSYDMSIKDLIRRFLCLKKESEEYESEKQHIISGQSPEVAEYITGFIEFYESNIDRLIPHLMDKLLRSRGISPQRYESEKICICKEYDSTVCEYMTLLIDIFDSTI